jgi:uncharacterized protein (DUF952 family)
VIVRIAARAAREAVRAAGAHRGDALETEGFVRCSTPARVVRVANAFTAAATTRSRR